jgi:hypothetical protein
LIFFIGNVVDRGPFCSGVGGRAILEFHPRFSFENDGTAAQFVVQVAIGVTYLHFVWL